MVRKLVYQFSLMGLLLLCGCGGSSDAPKLGQVSGVVKVDGKPAPNILVTFQPEEEGRPASGTTNESGEYTLQYSASDSGAKVGKNLVTISTPPPADDSDGCSCGEAEPFLDPIHPKYNSEARNNPDMTVEVKAGDNEFNFEVETDPSARKGTGCEPVRRRGPCICGE